MNYIRPSGAMALALVTAAFATCSDEKRAPQLADDVGGLPIAGSAGRGGSSGDAPDASLAAGAGGGGSGVVNCGEVTCRGAGKCLVDDDGEPTCVCDAGYILLESGDCVVDEDCIKLRSIEPGCRQRIGTEPAIAMAFNMETCAGTTVRAEIIGDITSAFKVTENDNDLGDESYATVFDRNVESWVTIAIDMSSSVAANGDLLVNVITSLKALVDDLASTAGELPVRIQLMPFGRSIGIALPFTTDLDSVQVMLDRMLMDPDEVVVEPDGTNLNGVINGALENMAATLEARVLQTGGAVVATGTLLTVTDGRDTSGVALKPIPARFNVISVGISGNIDDEELTRLGPQGSFLAPTDADRELAFATVAQRVKEYPNRAYLLAYCSPSIAGNHIVQATLANLEAAVSATCEFNAAQFGQGSPCNQDFINTFCEAEMHGCGGFLACDPECTALLDGGVSDWEFSE